MSAAVKLLEDCTSRGIRLRPGTAGMLKVSPPPEKLPAELREELRRHKPELLQLLTAAKLSPTWPCPRCRAAVCYDPGDDAVSVLPSRFWTCTNCPTWGVSRDKAPAPVAWIVTRTFQ